MKYDQRGRHLHYGFDLYFSFSHADGCSSFVAFQSLLSDKGIYYLKMSTRIGPEQSAMNNIGNAACERLDLHQHQR